MYTHTYLLALYIYIYIYICRNIRVNRSNKIYYMIFVRVRVVRPPGAAAKPHRMRAPAVRGPRPDARASGPLPGRKKGRTSALGHLPGRYSLWR